MILSGGRELGLGGDSSARAKEFWAFDGVI
jgi:hypothetical protein